MPAFHATRERQMPSILRFLIVVGLLGGLVYAGISSLAGYVQPQPREMIVNIPYEKLIRHR